jgi:hypothetical protein
VANGRGLGGWFLCNPKSYRYSTPYRKAWELHYALKAKKLSHEEIEKYLEFLLKVHVNSNEKLGVLSHRFSATIHQAKRSRNAPAHPRYTLEKLQAMIKMEDYYQQDTWNAILKAAQEVPKRTKEQVEEEEARA